MPGARPHVKPPFCPAEGIYTPRPHVRPSTRPNTLTRGLPSDSVNIHATGEGQPPSLATRKASVAVRLGLARGLDVSRFDLVRASRSLGPPGVFSEALALPLRRLERLPPPNTDT